MKRKFFALLLAVATIFSLGAVSANAEAVKTYYENTQDGSFFYPFAKDGDWTNSKLNLGNKTFLQSDGINHSGMLKVQIPAGGGNNSNGVKDVVMPENGKTVFRAKVRYPEYQNLVKAKTFVSFIFTGLKGAPLYNDEACTDPAGEASGGFVQVDVSADVNGTSIYDGAWHEIQAVIPSKGGKHSTGKYVDMTGVSSAVWIRIYNGNVFKADTSYFTQSYLDACTADGVTPSVTCLFDDLEGYHVNDSDILAETNTNYEKVYNFAADTYWTSAVANRGHEATWRGRSGVATATQAMGSMYTHTMDMNVKAGEKFRISGDVALGDIENLNTDKINVNALLIMNGGSKNNPAGFYEDAECTTPATSVNGNAIAMSATIQSGIGDDWCHFSYDFDTTQVIKSSIKRASSDGSKTTVYIKPWEVTAIAVWFRVCPGVPTAGSVATAAFTQAYQDACTAAGTKPQLVYGLDNLAVASVAEGDVLPTGIVVDSITADKETITVGDTVTVNYALAYGKTETASRVYVKADGDVIFYAKDAKGTVTFPVSEDLYGKTLSVEIAPAVGAYSLDTYEKALGTVTKVMFTAEKTANGVTWSYDAANDTENSIVIAALYNADKEMIACVPVTVTAGESFEDTVEDSGAKFAKVFHWVDTEDAQPIETNFSFELN